MEEKNEYKLRQDILQRWATKMQINYFLVNRFMENFTYKELCRDFILQEKYDGKSLRQLSIKYRFSIREIRTVCDNAMYEKEKNLNG